MKEVTLSDITKDDFDAASEIVISGIRAYNRRLDTRQGTVLRDLLVDPEAAIESVTSAQIEESRKSSSLELMRKAEEAGESIDVSDVEAILGNFNLKPSTGRPSRGTVKVTVSDGDIAYSVAAGAVFSTIDGVEFSADEQVVAARFTVSNPGVRTTSTLYEGAAGFFFLVPVTAVAVGSAGNILRGSALTPSSTISSFVSAEAYKDFDGGSDVQSMESIINSIPSGLSIRGFVNKYAVEGMLRDRFDPGSFPIVAVSSVGYGNGCQRRDKHNSFGVGVGGRIDVYVRNFSDMYTKTETVSAKIARDSEGNPVAGMYEMVVPVGMFPGGCWIKSISDPFNTNNVEDVLGSLAFTARRTADITGVWHDIDVSRNASEAFNTVWQGFAVTLTDVPADIPPNDSGDSSWSEERDFKVTVYCLPQASEIQEYVDDDSVRSVSSDVVVRCPIICNVSVNAIVRYDAKNPIDVDSARTKIRSYINGLGFVGRLSRSEIVQILKNLGAVTVDMPEKNMLSGSLVDAMGIEHVLYGDALDVSSIQNYEAMVSRDTVVFAAEDVNIQIKTIQNS